MYITYVEINHVRRMLFILFQVQYKTVGVHTMLTIFCPLPLSISSY